MRTLVVGRCLSACRAMLAAAALCALWVIVGHLGGALPQVLRLLQRGSDHTGGGAAHGRAVAEAVVGVGMENTSASALRGKGRATFGNQRQPTTAEISLNKPKQRVSEYTSKCQNLVRIRAKRNPETIV